MKPLIALPILLLLTLLTSYLAEAPQANVAFLLVLHYDTYYSDIDKPSMRRALEEAISIAKEAGYPGDVILVTCWRDVLNDADELKWLLETLEAHRVPKHNLGLFVAPGDAPYVHVLARHVDEYTRLMGFKPLFAAGFSMNPASYRLLSSRGVRVVLSNLWEEGEDFSFRGLSTGDRIKGANWEGAPHQPYKPSTRSACVPGGPDAPDAVNTWEVHWAFRNPSYAFTVVNSRHVGSLHPHDLLLDPAGARVSVRSALNKLESILSLVDLNAKLNDFVVLSYPVEISLLRDREVREVWRRTLLSFRSRGYRPLDAPKLLELLEPSAPMPTYTWIDTSGGAYAMVTSTRCRSIYLWSDPFNDAGSPKISFISYLTAKGFNATFQSVRELAGLRGLNVNVGGVNAESRWLGGRPEVVALRGVGVLIRREAPNLNYSSSVYLTASGVLVKVRASEGFEVVQPFNVQSNTPTPFADLAVLALTDGRELYPFSSDNREDLRIGLKLKRVVTLMAPDGYGLSVVLLNHSSVELIDLAGDAGVQLLAVRPWRGEVAYAITPTLDPDEAVRLASEVLVNAEAIGRATPTENHGPALPLHVAAVLVLALTALTILHLLLFRKR